MSCALCPCHSLWPANTLGINKRDPITCDKAWLDFAVRLLSREAVGKGRGQETVWSAKCRPQWWDAVVGLPWKNPTANPKDTKEVLLKKYTGLEKQLRLEGRFPPELEEEAYLWREGKHRELFLSTSLSSLVGTVRNVHVAIEDAYTKVNELGANINQSILTNIQNCLEASLKKTKDFDRKTQNEEDRTNLEKAKSRKRSIDKENSESHSIAKKSKLEESPLQGTSHESNDKEIHISNSIPSSNTQPSDILALAQKLLTKRNNVQHKNTSVRGSKSNFGSPQGQISSPKPQKRILPKPTLSATTLAKPSFNTSNINSPAEANNASSVNFCNPSSRLSYLSSLSSTQENKSLASKYTSVANNSKTLITSNSKSPASPLSKVLLHSETLSPLHPLSSPLMQPLTDSQPPICLKVSPEQLSWLLSQSQVPISDQSPQSSENQQAQLTGDSEGASKSSKVSVKSTPTVAKNSIFEISPSSSIQPVTEVHACSYDSTSTLGLSSNIQPNVFDALLDSSENTSSLPISFPEDLDSILFGNVDRFEKLCDEVLTENQNVSEIISENSEGLNCTPFSKNENLSFDEIFTAVEGLSQLDQCSSDEQCPVVNQSLESDSGTVCSRVKDGRVVSTDSSNSGGGACGMQGSDIGYFSDDGGSPVLGASSVQIQDTHQMPLVDENNLNNFHLFDFLLGSDDNDSLPELNIPQ